MSGDWICEVFSIVVDAHISYLEKISVRSGKGGHGYSSMYSTGLNYSISQQLGLRWIPWNARAKVLRSSSLEREKSFADLILYTIVSYLLPFFFFFLFFRRGFLAVACPAIICAWGESVEPTVASSFFIAVPRWALSFRIVSNLVANMTPSESDVPPNAVPIPKSPSTNWLGSN